MSSNLFVMPLTESNNYDNIERWENETDEDTRDVHRMGYQPILYRGFSSFMSFSLGFTAVSVIISITLGFSYTMNIGGTGVAIWSWIVGSFFTVLSSLALAEICSVYPSAGSVYHWYVYALAFCRSKDYILTGQVNLYLRDMLQ